MLNIIAQYYALPHTILASVATPRGNQVFYDKAKLSHSHRVLLTKIETNLQAANYKK